MKSSWDTPQGITGEDFGVGDGALGSCLSLEGGRGVKEQQSQVSPLMGPPGASAACERLVAKLIVQQLGLSCPGSWADTGVGLSQIQKESKS